MNMSKEKKKEILLKNFEIIKNNFGKNRLGIEDVVVKMFDIDVDTAKDMWIYLITRYEEELKHDSHCLAGGIEYGASEVIGETEVEKMILDTPELKRAFFSLMNDGTALHDGKIIRNKIAADELIVANELLDLLYNNPYRKDSWYRIMDNSMPWADRCEITEEAYELLETWCDKVEDEEERAKLSIKMLNYFD